MPLRKGPYAIRKLERDHFVNIRQSFDSFTTIQPVKRTSSRPPKSNLCVLQFAIWTRVQLSRVMSRIQQVYKESQ
ncbi:hypothetical protein ZYGR_0I03480 [Zygosaccharomyces rouxii]|uniref:ZYRO0C08316p n=2 Tax=Zygosaccharomyces rouxii TaxID=4956 RepID=C5DTG3_ZYGRC|nr:uncharacterized protein ZYRO0C08316g [Zygosaccharomyces rouxii]GAV48051.1 hypothetical protein ZYGR_0I03480 [Zygosaccharomyces rouxii]CAR27074.1 ZYRO0C08316p [Zygosaccharomyces rouxii]